MTGVVFGNPSKSAHNRWLDELLAVPQELSPPGESLASKTKLKAVIGDGREFPLRKVSENSVASYYNGLTTFVEGEQEVEGFLVEDTTHNPFVDSIQHIVHPAIGDEGIRDIIPIITIQQFDPASTILPAPLNTFASRIDLKRFTPYQAEFRVHYKTVPGLSSPPGTEYISVIMWFTIHTQSPMVKWEMDITYSPWGERSLHTLPTKQWVLAVAAQWTDPVTSHQRFFSNTAIVNSDAGANMVIDFRGATPQNSNPIDNAFLQAGCTYPLDGHVHGRIGQSQTETGDGYEVIHQRNFDSAWSGPVTAMVDSVAWGDSGFWPPYGLCFNDRNPRGLREDAAEEHKIADGNINDNSFASYERRLSTPGPIWRGRKLSMRTHSSEPGEHDQMGSTRGSYFFSRPRNNSNRQLFANPIAISYFKQEDIANTALRPIRYLNWQTGNTWIRGNETDMACFDSETPKPDFDQPGISVMYGPRRGVGQLNRNGRAMSHIGATDAEMLLLTDNLMLKERGEGVLNMSLDLRRAQVGSPVNKSTSRTVRWVSHWTKMAQLPQYASYKDELMQTVKRYALLGINDFIRDYGPGGSLEGRFFKSWIESQNYGANGYPRAYNPWQEAICVKGLYEFSLVYGKEKLLEESPFFFFVLKEFAKSCLKALYKKSGDRDNWWWQGYVHHVDQPIESNESLEGIWFQRYDVMVDRQFMPAVKIYTLVMEEVGPFLTTEDLYYLDKAERIIADIGPFRYAYPQESRFPDRHHQRQWYEVPFTIRGQLDPGGDGGGEIPNAIDSTYTGPGPFTDPLDEQVGIEVTDISIGETPTAPGQSPFSWFKETI